MPGFDQTGPMGGGPMTGGARGRCNPATPGNIPAFTGGCGYGRLGIGRSFRGGYGPGKGRGSRFWQRLRVVSACSRSGLFDGRSR